MAEEAVEYMYKLEYVSAMDGITNFVVKDGIDHGFFEEEDRLMIDDDKNFESLKIGDVYWFYKNAEPEQGLYGMIVAKEMLEEKVYSQGYWLYIPIKNLYIVEVQQEQVVVPALNALGAGAGAGEGENLMENPSTIPDEKNETVKDPASPKLGGRHKRKSKRKPRGHKRKSKRKSTRNTRRNY